MGTCTASQVSAAAPTAEAKAVAQYLNSLRGRKPFSTVLPRVLKVAAYYPLVVWPWTTRGFSTAPLEKAAQRRVTIREAAAPSTNFRQRGSMRHFTPSPEWGVKVGIPMEISLSIIPAISTEPLATEAGPVVKTSRDVAPSTDLRPTKP